MSTLYLVGTPIGNLEDISPRALNVLKKVSLIAAEDTRTARRLLTHFDIHTTVTSFFEHSKPGKLEQLLDGLRVGDVAVVSEAGMPGINDPGFELVHAAIERGVQVTAIPGPSAVITALVASGLPADSFYYLGFLPRDSRARRNLLRQVADETDTLLAFETPRRLRDALADMELILGATRPICLARELTKKFEEFRRGTVAEIVKHFTENEPRGEFTLVIAGTTVDLSSRSRRARPRAAAEIGWNETRVKREFQKLVQAGIARTEAVKQIARASKWERRRVYQLTLKKES